MTLGEPLREDFSRFIEQSAQPDPRSARREAAGRIGMDNLIAIPRPGAPIYTVLPPSELRDNLATYTPPRDVSFSMEEAPDGGTEITWGITVEGITMHPSIADLDNPDPADREPATYTIVSTLDNNNLLNSIRIKQAYPNNPGDKVPDVLCEWAYEEVSTDPSGKPLVKPYYFMKEAKYSTINDDGNKVVTHREEYDRDGNVSRDTNATLPGEISFGGSMQAAINVITPYKGEPVVPVDSALALFRQAAKGDMKGVIEVEDLSSTVVRVRIIEAIMGAHNRVYILVNNGYGFYPIKFDRQWIPVSPMPTAWAERRDANDTTALHIFQTEHTDPHDPTSPLIYEDRKTLA